MVSAGKVGGCGDSDVDNGDIESDFSLDAKEVEAVAIPSSGGGGGGGSGCGDDDESCLSVLASSFCS